MEHSPRTGASDRVERTDPELIAAISHFADHSAWTEFDARYAPIIRRFARALGLRGADLDDVIQDVYLRLSRAPIAHAYDPDRGRFRSYLYRVTRSAITTVVGADRIPRALDDETDSAAVETWNDAWTRDVVDHVLRLVTRTSSVQAGEVLDLSLRGMTPAQIARATGLSLEAVYKCRQRQRATIERLLSQHGAVLR